MAPITCSVIDTRGLGVQGVHVILECYDLGYNCLASLNSITDHNGEIGSWFPIFSSNDGGITESKVMDTTTTPRASLAFFPHPLLIGNAPWTSIHTDVHLDGLTNHVILHVSEAPRLEYKSYPLTNPIGSIVALRDLHTPSPLQLPSPVLVTHGEQDNESAQTVDSDRDATATRKRGRGAYDDESARKSRPRVE